MKKIISNLFVLFTCVPCFGQSSDSFFIRKIFDAALTKSQCYETLTQLTTQIGGRLSGSQQAADAVQFMKKVMQQNAFDTVWLQPCYVPHWIRGDKEVAFAVSGGKKTYLSITSLGNSEGTGPAGLTAQVIEIKNFHQLDSLGRKNIAGKIVFYNHPFDASLVNTFDAYGQAVVYRVNGASQAAKYGAKAAIVRSMTEAEDDYPHTGSMAYNDSFPKIPTCAVSALGAEKLDELVRNNSTVNVYLRNTSHMMADSVLSYNVIGELRGKQMPNQYIVVSGHLDSWETGKGAQDDGAGSVQSIEVLRIFKELNLKPNHTIRCVLWMNEENGTKGARKYAAEVKRKNESHLFALESDAGGFSPRGFGFEGDDSIIQKVMKWRPLFEPYGANTFIKGESGADVGKLKGECTLLGGLSPDPQRYFDYHHAASDVIENVNKRELELGAATMASLIYLVDKYGL